MAVMEDLSCIALGLCNGSVVLFQTDSGANLVYEKNVRQRVIVSKDVNPVTGMDLLILCFAHYCAPFITLLCLLSVCRGVCLYLLKCTPFVCIIAFCRYNSKKSSTLKIRYLLLGLFFQRAARHLFIVTSAFVKSYSIDSEQSV